MSQATVVVPAEAETSESTAYKAGEASEAARNAASEAGLATAKAEAAASAGNQANDAIAGLAAGVAALATQTNEGLAALNARVETTEHQLAALATATAAAIDEIAEDEDGEELTDDYGTLNPDEPFPCLCASRDCRGHVLPDDMLRLGETWNALAREAFFLIPSLPQPLWEIMPDRAVNNAC